ncbi:MAG: SMC-Scp complex subunit ScpB [Candidatus Bathyarchaeia archaeon]
MATEQTQETETELDEKTAMHLVEAALYVAGRPLDLKTIGSVVGTRSKAKAKALVRSLAEEYLRRNGALEILELEGERFVMQLKSSYVARVKRLSLKPLLSQAALRTLAYIAYRQPVAQAQVALVRGALVYNQIRELEKLGLITAEKLGKTQILRTTEVFADYFNLSRDPRLMRRQLKALFDENGKLMEKSC